MARKVEPETGIAPVSKASSKAPDVYDRVAEAGARCYDRARDLPCLIALWPHELADLSPQGALRILSKLRAALRAERRRGRAGHWSYELNRHLALLSAYKGEIALLRAVSSVSRNAPGAAEPTSELVAKHRGAKAAPRLSRRSR